MLTSEENETILRRAQLSRLIAPTGRCWLGRALPPLPSDRVDHRGVHEEMPERLDRGHVGLNRGKSCHLVMSAISFGETLIAASHLNLA